MNFFRRKPTARQLCDTLYRELNSSVLLPGIYVPFFPYEEGGYRFQLAIASAVENYLQYYVKNEHRGAFEEDFFIRLLEAMVDRFEESNAETCLALVSFYPPEKIAVCAGVRIGYKTDAANDTIYGSRFPIWRVYDLLQSARVTHFQVQVSKSEAQGLSWPNDVALALAVCAPFWAFGGPQQKESECKFFAASLLESAKICQRACLRLTA